MNKIIVVAIALLIALPACGKTITLTQPPEPMESQILRRIVQLEKEQIELRQKLDELEQKLIDEHLNIIKQSVGAAK